MNLEEERKAFEDQITNDGYVEFSDYSFEKDECDCYIDERVECAWFAYCQAYRRAKAVPEGFVLVEKSKVRTWYQDDDEPENFCNSESDLDCLGDCLDSDDIIIVNIHESVHISTKKVFGVWKSNSPTDIQSKFMLVDSRVEAEQIVTANKAMIEAQEQNG